MILLYPTCNALHSNAGRHKLLHLKYFFLSHSYLNASIGFMAAALRAG